MFSSRIPGDFAMNRLSAAVASHRRGGRPLLDLTVSNPTKAGIVYPHDLLSSMGSPTSTTYSPEPFGAEHARSAVSRDYARRGISVALQRIVLTASTSEAYSVLFKLLCEPTGDDVLVPAPSYPLFEHLAQLDGVTPRSFVLEYHGRWELEEGSLDAAWTDRTRAVLAVSPNNPTGSVLSDAEFAAITSRCAQRGAALVVDEVFADYPLARAGEERSTVSLPQSDALTFRLGGLSKSVGLPQVKLGWIAVEGPDDLVAAALERLELICDTYLSVSTPVQVAAPDLIKRGAAVRTQIQQRIRANYALLESAVQAHPSIELLRADAGWTAVLRVPAGRTEEEIVLTLLSERDTLVHPGFFFDFAHEAFVVVSLLPEPHVFAEGVSRLLEHVHA